MTEKLHISWEEFHHDTRELCTKIKNYGNYNKIVVVSRGGLLPSGVLAYELNIRNTAVINISTYDGNVQRAAEDFEFAVTGVGKVDEHTLIVDDLSDTGNTYNLLRKHFPQACFVSVYVKHDSRNAVDIYAREMPDSWLIFPWD